MEGATTTRAASLPSTSTTSLFVESDEDKHMLPCRFFAHGYCHKGNRCRFYHPTPANMRTSIRVPALPLGFERVREIIRQPSLRRERNQQRQTFAASLMNPSAGMGPLYRPSPRSRSQPFNNISNQFRFNNRQSIPRGFGGGYSENSTKYGDRGWDELEFHNNGYNGRVPLFIPPLNLSYDRKDSAKFYEQNTVFRHIKWSDFLAPGAVPPPPVQVPIPKDREHVAHISALNAAARELAELCRASPQHGAGDNETESSLSSQEDHNDKGDGDGPKKLSAKEELQRKVHEIGLEMANEPTEQQPLISLDSYFRNYNFSDPEREEIYSAHLAKINLE